MDPETKTDQEQHLSMDQEKQIKSALIAVFNKEGIDPVVKQLHEQGVQLYSTGGTHEYIKGLGLPVGSVEGLTSFPSIFGGRVKTLHPKVFGGILARRGEQEDVGQLEEYHIPEIDLVVVDLYPFEETLATGGTEAEVIEKIDIGGVSLIRAAAKNFRDVMVIPSRHHYDGFLELLEAKGGNTSLEDRLHFARQAFTITAHYDTQIANYFHQDDQEVFQKSIPSSRELRYGENPHQKGVYYGDLDKFFHQYSGKALSYNNLLDVDAAVRLMAEFSDASPTMAVIKHNNACGLAVGETLSEAWDRALAGDPVSAFGGIIISNTPIDKATAEKVHELFFEVLIAPGYDEEALAVLTQKKKRVVLEQKGEVKAFEEYRTILNGVLYQDKDDVTDLREGFETATQVEPDEGQLADLEFAGKVVKHTRSNAIVLAREQQLCASGTGQTSRVDALKQAIQKARSFGFDLEGAVMASDAFFPFKDCVEIAGEAGIKAVIQPGGSIRDQESIDHCNMKGMAMVFTGHRHFKH